MTRASAPYPPIAPSPHPARESQGPLAVYTLLVYLFLYAPILILIVFSFNQSKQTAVWEGFTLDWYAALLHDELIYNAATRSLIVAGLTTLISVAIGTPVGVALGRYRFRGAMPTQVLLYLPIIIPEIVMGVALATFFGIIGMEPGLLTVLIAHVTFCVSYVAVLVRARMAGMDPALAEAAADLGAGPVATFFRVTLPLLAPGILAGALLVFTISLDDYLITSLVAGPETTTLPMRIYSMLRTGVTPEINAVSTLLLLFTVLLILAAQMLLRKGAD
jgi:spermidine/putrescine transport system permease protein